MKDVRIYICTHKESYFPEDPLYHPLQAGRALHEDLGYEGDNTGDNISGKNETYGELTGMYWVWKNVTCDIVGICREERYFCYNEDIIRKFRIEQLLEEYDVILEKREKTDGSKASGQNMLITGKSLYDEYCAWLFEILSEIEKKFAAISNETLFPRIFAVLAESLQEVFFTSKGCSVWKETVERTNLQYYQEAEKAVCQKKRILKELLGPLIHAYSAENPVDLTEWNPKPQNFHGKLPVWVCWWQGEDQMPDIVKACYHSLQMNLPEDETEIHLITWETLEKYVDFPNFIWEKYEKKKITLTHLSDILRMTLLHLYGGFWMDATILLTERPENWILQGEGIYTQCFKELQYSSEIVVKGRWTGNFLRAQKGDPLPRFLCNAFYFYWAVNETLIDYFLIDYLILIAYEEIPEIRESINACPPSQMDYYSIEFILNEAFEEKKWQRLTRDTCFFKLSYKHIFETETADGKPTFYAHIMNQYKNISND